MKRGYISQVHSAREFQEQIRLFEQQGVSLDNVSVNISFEAYVASLNEGDRAVIYSYVGLFPSLGSYLTTAMDMMEKSVIIESLLEPNVIINASNCEFVRELNGLNRSLRSSSSLRSINKLKSEGKKLGRPHGSSVILQKKVAQVEKLRNDSNISVVAACRLADCNPKTYYRLKSKTNV